MSDNSYPWIMTGPARRDLPIRPASQVPIVTCGRCGWQVRGRRKKCPACLVKS